MNLFDKNNLKYSALWFSVNSIVIHCIFAKINFYQKKTFFFKFSWNSKFAKENLLLSDYNSLNVFDFEEREFSFSNLEFQEKLAKLSLFDLNLLCKNIVIMV